jgi:phosphoribosylaminoimidazole-succinocarboxamide synthase
MLRSSEVVRNWDQMDSEVVRNWDQMDSEVVRNWEQMDTEVVRNWDQMDSEVVRANRLLYTYCWHEIRMDVVSEDSSGLTFIPRLVKIEQWMQ